MTKKSSSREVHVVHDGSKWKVKKTGNQRATSTHDNKEEAIKSGRQEAEKEGSELVIHRKDGTIQDKDSHGHDPNPPKDRKP